MLFILLLVFGVILAFAEGLSPHISWGWGDKKIHVGKKQILHLELNGVIMDGKKLIKPLLKYRDDSSIKAIVIEINSPGGVVGPSQEIYEEIRRAREDFKKPVVAVSTGVMASGAYYAAVAADRIVVAPGTMMGSIGVIMEFTNLEKLYDWAKVSRFSISTGKFKDSGAEYRAMRSDEKALFQDLVNDVYGQFVDAVAEGRDLKTEFVRKYADGRVFTGKQGIDLGFADEIGTVDDAFEIAADMAGIDDYDIFEPPKPRASLMDFIRGGDDDDDATTLFHPKGMDAQIGQALKSVLRLELANKPLFLMPGAY